jgi:hypothetical protein
MFDDYSDEMMTKATRKKRGEKNKRKNNVMS